MSASGGVGSVAEEAALLAAALRSRDGSSGRTAAAPCAGCPLCRASAALHAHGPELAAAAGTAVVALRDLLRTARAAYGTTTADAAPGRRA